MGNYTAIDAPPLQMYIYIYIYIYIYNLYIFLIVNETLIPQHDVPFILF